MWLRYASDLYSVVVLDGASAEFGIAASGLRVSPSAKNQNQRVGNYCYRSGCYNITRILRICTQIEAPLSP